MMSELLVLIQVPNILLKSICFLPEQLLESTDLHRHCVLIIDTTIIKSLSKLIQTLLRRVDVSGVYGLGGGGSAQCCIDSCESSNVLSIDSLCLCSNGIHNLISSLITLLLNLSSLLLHRVHDGGVTVSCTCIRVRDRSNCVIHSSCLHLFFAFSPTELCTDFTLSLREPSLDITDGIRRCTAGSRNCLRLRAYHGACLCQCCLSRLFSSFIFSE